MPCSATVNVVPDRITSTRDRPQPVPIPPSAAPAGTPEQNTRNDAPVEPLTGTPTSCKDFPVDGYADYAIYSKKVSNYFTLADLSTGGAAGPFKIINASLKGHTITTQTISRNGQQPQTFTAQNIACHLSLLAKNILDPIYDYSRGRGWTMRINSGFRQGASEGDHGRGLAADLSFTKSGGVSVTETERLELMQWAVGNLGSRLRQIIFEKTSQNAPIGWIHVAATTETIGPSAFKIGVLIGPAYSPFQRGYPGSCSPPYVLKS
jgi:hypothetical protein